MLPVPRVDDALVVTEGLLLYLTDEQVGALAAGLHDAGGFHWWLFDLASPRLLRLMQRMWGRTVNAGDAPFRFAPAAGTGFFRPFGWREVAFRSSIDDARRLGREMRLMWLWRLLGRLGSAKRRDEARRMSAAVMMARE